MERELPPYIPGDVTLVEPGDRAVFKLLDGTVLNIEQTQDDFSITHEDGTVAYTKPTSKVAKAIDADVPQMSGHG